MAIFMICAESANNRLDSKGAAKKIRVGWPFGEVYVPARGGRSKGWVVTAKRQLSPASRLQQWLNAHRSVYEQFMKMQHYGQ